MCAGAVLSLRNITSIGPWLETWHIFFVFYTVLLSGTNALWFGGSVVWSGLCFSKHILFCSWCKWLLREERKAKRVCTSTLGSGCLISVPPFSAWSCLLHMIICVGEPTVAQTRGWAHTTLKSFTHSGYTERLTVLLINHLCCKTLLITLCSESIKYN